MITDEMVGIAYNAYDKVGTFHTGCETIALRAALEAVVPMILARGMRQASEIIRGGAYGSAQEAYGAILDRAQELDPVIRDVLSEIADCAKEIDPQAGWRPYRAKELDPK